MAKTVFLLALASGKRMSEIHAWAHSSVSSRRNWSEVTVSPSPAFLAKNQLASDGPDSIKPVVIPALTTMLVSSHFKVCMDDLIGSCTLTVGVVFQLGTSDL